MVKVFAGPYLYGQRLVAILYVVAFFVGCCRWHNAFDLNDPLFLATLIVCVETIFLILAGSVLDVALWCGGANRAARIFGALLLIMTGPILMPFAQAMIDDVFLYGVGVRHFRWVNLMLIPDLVSLVPRGLVVWLIWRNTTRRLDPPQAG